MHGLGSPRQLAKRRQPVHVALHPDYVATKAAVTLDPAVARAHVSTSGQHAERAAAASKTVDSLLGRMTMRPSVRLVSATMETQRTDSATVLELVATDINANQATKDEPLPSPPASRAPPQTPAAILQRPRFASPELQSTAALQHRQRRKNYEGPAGTNSVS